MVESFFPKKEMPPPSGPFVLCHWAKQLAVVYRRQKATTEVEIFFFTYRMISLKLIPL